MRHVWPSASRGLENHNLIRCSSAAADALLTNSYVSRMKLLWVQTKWHMFLRLAG